MISEDYSDSRISEDYSDSRISEDHSDIRAVILDRYDTLDQLNQKFPGLVRQEILFTLVSEFYDKRIDVYCIKIDVEVVLVGILVDGDYSSHK